MCYFEHWQVTDVEWLGHQPEIRLGNEFRGVCLHNYVKVNKSEKAGKVVFTPFFCCFVCRTIYVKAEIGKQMNFTRFCAYFISFHYNTFTVRLDNYDL